MVRYLKERTSETLMPHHSALRVRLSVYSYTSSTEWALVNHLSVDPSGTVLVDRSLSNGLVLANISDLTAGAVVLYVS